MYSTTYFNAQELPKRLKEIADKAKNNNLSFGNPVSDFLPKEKIKGKSIEKKIVVEQEEKNIDLESNK